MNEKLQSDLVKAYPKIFKDVGGDPKVTCMADGIQCNDGWYDLLDTLCHTMQRWCDGENTRYIIETDKYEFVVEGDPEYVQVVASQVKEKLGELRFYVDGGDATTQGIIQMAENMSSRICELCGSPAKTNRDSGWMHTTCESCNKRIRLERQGWKGGSAEERVVLDVGIGFGKTVEHNETLLRANWDGLARPLCWGLSRKSFLQGVQTEKKLKNRDEALDWWNRELGQRKLPMVWRVHEPGRISRDFAE